MPSQFERFMAANLSFVHEVFGLAAVYTAPDGTVTSDLTVRVQRHEAQQVERSGGASGEMQTADVMVLQTALAKPVKGGRFKVENVEVWTIETTPTLKNGQHSCRCSRAGVERMMDRRAKDA